MAAFGDLLSELRRDKKMTQDDLAKVLFVSPGTISNYENNIHFPDVPKLIQMAKYFGVTTDYILGLSSCNLSPTCWRSEWLQAKRGAKSSWMFKHSHQTGKRRCCAFLVTCERHRS